MKQAFSITTILFCAGCTMPNLQNVSNIGKESDPTRFYTLTATAAPAALQANRSPVIVLELVEIAAYLDRSHIVMRESATELSLSEFDRWAAAPASEIRRVLVQDLAQQLGTQAIMLDDNNDSIQPDYHIRVRVERFEYTENGEALLEVAWQAIDRYNKERAISRRTYREKVIKDYRLITLALSQLVERLGTDIASAITHKAVR